MLLNRRAGREAASGLVIEGGLLFDGVESVENDVLVIEHDRIARIGGRSTPPAATPTIDARGLAIVPGLIDLHVHFGAPVGPDLNRTRAALVVDYARQRPRHRRAFIEAGVTTIRSVGDVVGVRRDILDLKRRSQAAGYAGPRVFAAGPVFTAPGGHPAATIYRASSFLVRHAAREVASPEEARAEVGRLAQQGVDGIKAVFDSLGDTLPRLDPDVLRALAEEAHDRGLWIAVHTGSADDIQEAVAAGADTIEHGATDGSEIQRTTLALMRERDVTYVPTLAVVEVMAKLAATRERPRGFPAELWETLRARAELITRDPLEAAMANVRTAATAGVRVATGTDAQGPRMGFGTSLHRELELLVASGLTPRAALTAATSAAGAALRVDGLGRLGVGAPADIVLAAAEPWADIRKLRDIRAVIRAGRIASGQPRSGRRRR